MFTIILESFIANNLSQNRRSMAADAVENKEADRTTEARKAEATCT